LDEEFVAAACARTYQRGNQPELSKMGNPESGYGHPAYAAAVADGCEPRLLQRSGGHVLVREIGTSAQWDAIGPYPLFSCTDWDGLAEDLSELSTDLVSVALVVDPFGAWTEGTLRSCFPDTLVRFKEHFAVRLTADPLRHIHHHHRRNVAKGRDQLEVELVTDLAGFAGEWEMLYRHLVDRHQIRGRAAFSVRSLAAQLAVPGMVALRARIQGTTVGATLWYEQGNVAYYHLAAYDPRGYELRASFALFANALELFVNRGLVWASLGAGAGTNGDPNDGLSRFKRGWSTDVRPAWFGGRVLRRDVYERLAGPARSQWFPAYRQGELG
jgi:hypothetical protein